jgi:DNA-binding NarL/FixJ family response regulator
VLGDDHGIVRRGLKALLDTEDDIEVVGEAGDGLEALRMCETHRPDVAILDIAMPRLNGIDVAERAIKHQPQLKVVFLSMYADESYVLRALSAGARGYLLKESTEQDLLPALRTISQGKPYFSPTISAMLLSDYMLSAADRSRKGSAAAARRGTHEQGSREHPRSGRVHHRDAPREPDAEARTA